MERERGRPRKIGVREEGVNKRERTKLGGVGVGRRTKWSIKEEDAMDKI